MLKTHSFRLGGPSWGKTCRQLKGHIPPDPLAFLLDATCLISVQVIPPTKRTRGQRTRSKTTLIKRQSVIYLFFFFFFSFLFCSFLALLVYKQDIKKDNLVFLDMGYLINDVFSSLLI